MKTKTDEKILEERAPLKMKVKWEVAGVSLAVMLACFAPFGAVADVDLPPFDGWLTKSPQVVLYGAQLNELSGFTAWVGGNYVSEAMVDGHRRHWFAEG